MSKEEELEEKRLNAMKYKILELEQENLKTQEKNYGTMVEEIEKIISTEANKNY